MSFDYSTINLWALCAHPVKLDKCPNCAETLSRSESMKRELLRHIESGTVASHRIRWRWLGACLGRMQRNA